MASPIRVSMRERNASPISMCFPEIRKLIRQPTFLVQIFNRFEFIPVTPTHKHDDGFNPERKSKLYG